jgi:DNA-binding transcriptional ArsR family regulator
VSGRALVAVARHVPHRRNTLLVAFRLADYTAPTGWAWPSIALLAEETGLARSTVSRAIARLEDDGLLHVERSRSRRGHRYRLLLDGVPGNLLEEAPDRVTTDSPGVSSDVGTDSPGVSSDDRNRLTSASNRLTRGPELTHGESRSCKNLEDPDAARADEPSRANERTAPPGGFAALRRDLFPTLRDELEEGPPIP